jgi:predicted NBD/HSP70 family sugar kinase
MAISPTDMRSQGANPGHSRLFNLRVVFDMVRINGPISRAELARRANLTKQTIGVIADELCQAGLLREEGRKTGGIGKPSTQLVLNPDGAYSLGLHLDRDQLIGVLCDLTGQVRQRHQLEAPTATPEAAAVLLQDLVTELLGQSGVEKRLIIGTGLVMPGPFGVEHVGPTSLPGWDGLALARTLSERIDLPVLLENDATASAIAEAHIGIARNMQNFCLIYLGIGLGVGIVVDGQPYTGATSNAGEFGHLIVQPGGRPCACGNAGCLERYVSLHAAFEALSAEQRPIQSIHQFRYGISPKDAAILSWMGEAASPLRLGINALENLFDPEAIIFGGDAPDWVIDGLIERVQPLLPSVRTRRDRTSPRLLRAATLQDMAALGAAAMVIFNALNPSYKWLFHGAEDNGLPAHRHINILRSRA